MVPVTSAFNNLVKAKVTGSVLSKTEAELEVQQQKLKLLKQEEQLKEKNKELLDKQIIISKQTIETEGLNDTIRRLQNVQLSVQGMTKISELALTATNLKNTQLHTKRTNINKTKGKDAPGWIKIVADKVVDTYKDVNTYDEYLAVITHDIVAKQGVDLNEVKVANALESPNTIIVSGIIPKYIGSSKNIPTPEMQEIRTHILDFETNQRLAVEVKNDAISIQLANAFMQEKTSEFQSRLSEGLETSFLNESVVELAQQFILIALAPLEKKIEFRESAPNGALPLLKYIQHELNTSTQKKNELESNNKALKHTVDLLSEEKQNMQSEMTELINGENQRP